MRLILIRHGQTPSNVSGALDTARPGAPLTDLGMEQAAAIPAALATEQIDAIYISPLVRTHLTAAPLAAARGLTPTLLEGIEEISAGSLEMMEDVDSRRSYLKTVFGWAVGEVAVPMPGGPDGADFFARFDAAIAEVAAHGHQAAAVVSHGAAIRLWATVRSGNLPFDYGRHHELDNTGIVTLVGDPVSGWVAEHWQGEPIGGSDLSDPTAADPTGEAVEA